jgi:hypothetical protein
MASTRLQQQTPATANPKIISGQAIRLQRKCACGGSAGIAGECHECSKQNFSPHHLIRKPELDTPNFGGVTHIVHEVLRSPGQPLDGETRAFMEPRFGHDFSRVRVHTDAKAAESAIAMNALAYTVGRDVVFGTAQYAPGTLKGRRLLMHELTHVLQQGSTKVGSNTQLTLGEVSDKAEAEAERATNEWGGKASNPITRIPTGGIQRQFITPIAAGGGYGGIMERDRQVAMAPFRVCSRDLQGVLGYIGNHAYIDAPPHRYAIISPLCPGSAFDNPVTGTTAQKWDNSPDPCGKTPNCVACQPRPGVTDLAQCFRSAFNSYNNPSLYRGLGPNSNTFAGTLARTCCAGMVPKPVTLGNVPGWDDSPAPARAGATPCPPGPVC